MLASISTINLNPHSQDKSNLLLDIIPILTASVPIIKVQASSEKLSRRLHTDKKIDLFQDFSQSVNYTNYPFSKDEFARIRVDITLINLTLKQVEDNIAERFQNTSKSVAFVNETLKAYPEIRPVVLVVKRVLAQNNLNSYFKGGLSSYCLFLLVLGFVKIYKNKTMNMNLGLILIEFFEFYGFYYDFFQCGIDVRAVK